MRSRSNRKILKIFLLSAVMTLLMAGSVFAANLASGTYRLTPAGYVCWSDFNVPQQETVTVNLTTSTISKGAFTQKSLDALTYQFLNKATGEVVSTYTRNGALRYTQVRSSAVQVYDRLTAALPAGSYRFRIMDTEAANQPVITSYTVTDGRAAAEELRITSPVTLTAGQTAALPVRDNLGRTVTITGVSSYDGEGLEVSWSGSRIQVATTSDTPAGTYHVRVNANYGSTYLSREIQIIVNPDDSKAKLLYDSMTIMVGETGQNYVTSASWAANVNWKSSNSKIASVKKNGKYAEVTGVKAGTCTVTGSYRGRTFSCDVTVEPLHPEFQARIRRISQNRKYIYIRIKNLGTEPLTFYSAGAQLHTMAVSDNNTAVSSSMIRIKFVTGKNRVIAPGKAATIKMKKPKGKFPSTSVLGLEARLRFRYAKTRYTAGLESDPMNSQYCFRKDMTAWYPAYTDKNNYSGQQ